MRAKMIFAVAMAASFAEALSAQGFISVDDYPLDSVRNGEEGIVGFIVEVPEAGLAENCRITLSSSFSSLDNATCRMIVRRARFKPALDSCGKPTRGSFSSQVRWQLPKK